MGPGSCRPERPTASGGPGASLREVLYGALRVGTGVTTDEELAAQAMAAWAMVHGIAHLWLTGNLPYARDSTVIRQAFAEVGPALIRVAVTTAEQLRTSQAR